jgi:hypothetical protein
MPVNIREGVPGLRPEAEGAKELSPGFQPVGARHAKMRPESGAGVRGRTRTISIRYGAPDSGAPSGHIALNCPAPG